MENLEIAATKSTPHILFDAATAHLRIDGESYPENVVKFYAPVFEWLQAYFANKVKQVKFEFQIVYFNSSTSKIFMSIFDLLEQEAVKGCKIDVLWICDPDNDVAIECGEEFQEEVEKISFKVDVR